MMPFLLVAGVLLGVATATANQSAFGAQSWGQARQPGWSDQPVYFDGYETPRSQFDLGLHDRYEYRNDDARRDDDRPRVGTGYGGYDAAPQAGRNLDGFIDRDGRWVERSRESAQGYPDDRYVPPARGRYSDVTTPAIPTGTSSPQPEYRFRGDPQPWSGRASGYDETAGYRFRPLTDQEAEQRAQTPGWRPLEQDRNERGGRARSPAGLMDALTPPPRTFGFEPAPWP
jgi:hypothetical protein